MYHYGENCNLMDDKYGPVEPFLKINFVFILSHFTFINNTECISVTPIIVLKTVVLIIQP